jgi:hypothetical protein
MALVLLSGDCTKLFLTSLATTGVLVLSGCHIDESFSTEGVPVHSTGSQVTPGNQSVGRSPFRNGNFYNTSSVENGSNVVTTGSQSTVVVMPERSINGTNAPAPAASNVIPVTAPMHTQSAHVQSVPVQVQSAPTVEPVVRSTPSDVIVSHN